MVRAQVVGLIDLTVAIARTRARVARRLTVGHRDARLLLAEYVRRDPQVAHTDRAARVAAAILTHRPIGWEAGRWVLEGCGAVR